MGVVSDLQDFRAASGEPGYWVCLRFVWRRFQERLTAWSVVLDLESRGTSNAAVRRARVRLEEVERLLEDLCDVAIENEWSIPREIAMRFSGDVEEGQ
jgi:hypothetical protein